MDRIMRFLGRTQGHTMPFFLLILVTTQSKPQATQPQSP